MSYLLLQMLLYMLGAFLLGLLLGWLIWGQLRARLAGAHADLVAARGDTERVKSDLSACGSARADLERRLRVSEEAAAGLRGERDRAKAELDACVQARADIERRRDTDGVIVNLRRERDKLKDDLDACGRMRADLEGRLGASGAAPVGIMGTPSVAQPDNLRELIGIGPVNERLLHEQGITTFAQIAAWTPEDVERIEKVLAFDGRIAREHWVEQARLLATGSREEFLRQFPQAGSSNNT